MWIDAVAFFAIERLARGHREKGGSRGEIARNYNHSEVVGGETVCAWERTKKGREYEIFHLDQQSMGVGDYLRTR